MVNLAGVPAGTEGYTPGRNYTQLPCDNCGKPAWIGPTQRHYRTLFPGNATFWCMPCAVLAGFVETAVENPHADSRFEKGAREAAAKKWVDSLKPGPGRE